MAKSWTQGYDGEWRRDPPREKRGDNGMCFQLTDKIYDERGRELASRSPWRFLDACRTPAERQAAIYRHQHKSVRSHFEVQDRAEAYAAQIPEIIDLWCEDKDRTVEIIADLKTGNGDYFMRGAAIGLLAGVAAMFAFIALTH